MLLNCSAPELLRSQLALGCLCLLVEGSAICRVRLPFLLQDMCCPNQITSFFGHILVWTMAGFLHRLHSCCCIEAHAWYAHGCAATEQAYSCLGWCEFVSEGMCTTQSRACKSSSFVHTLFPHQANKHGECIPLIAVPCYRHAAASICGTHT